MFGYSGADVNMSQQTVNNDPEHQTQTSNIKVYFHHIYNFLYQKYISTFNQPYSPHEPNYLVAQLFGFRKIVLVDQN